MTTIYEYNGQELYKDEADAYQIEEIQRHYAQHFPELNQATYTVTPAVTAQPEAEGQPAVEAQPRKVVFAKKVGTKGALNPVVERLLKIEPKPIAAVELLHRMNAGEFDTLDALQRIGPEIAEALDEAADIFNKSERIVQRCLSLSPVPSTHPHGF